MADLQGFTFSTETDDGTGRFIATSPDGIEAELTWHRDGRGRIVADHTGVPRSLGGQGVGTALVERLVHFARAEDAPIVPACSFVDAQLRRHSEWQDRRA